MKIYISGKISGLNYGDVVDKFEQSELELIAGGNEPVNPVKLVPFSESWEWSDYMRADIKLLMDCEAIYMQKDYHQSKGAMIEFKIAHMLGMMIIHQ